MEVLFLLLLLLLNANSVRMNLLCGDNKCVCGQESTENIPTFTVDCSRLELESSPEQTLLPYFTGHLDLSYNNIAYLNQSVQLSLTSVYYLDYSHNKIRFISNEFFHQLPHLKYLSLKHNQIEIFRPELITGLKQLQYLNLESNQLVHLPSFTQLNHLKTLKLGANNLGKFLNSINLSNYIPESCNSLDLKHVNYTEINGTAFDSMHFLNSLNLAFNPINDFPIISLHNLTYLDISGINITHLNSSQLAFTSLKTLKLNRLPYLRTIQPYTFSQLVKIEEIQLEHCTRLTEIDPLAFGSFNHSKITLKKLSLAYCAFGTLSYTFQQLFGGLNESQLRGNLWQCDCRLKWLNSVKKNVKDYEEIICSFPDHLRHIKYSELSSNRRECLVEKVENKLSPSSFQKWLFPIVGVLSIVVIILVGLLIYMGPYETEFTLYGRTRTIGPESPYQRITMIQPNSAENHYLS